MKFLLAAFITFVGANAAAIERRADPGCPDLMPFQVSPPQIYLCSAYDLSYVRIATSELFSYLFYSRRMRVIATDAPIGVIALANQLDR
jgi:hypothetical protein